MALSNPTSTRDRILEAANARFIDHGYDGTSLREIAEDLGVTKAALYYHFQSKEQILEALIEPMGQLINSVMGRLSESRTLVAWGETIVAMLDEMYEHFELFRLMERNRQVVETLFQESDVFQDHELMHRRLQQALEETGFPLPQRVRMVAALAAVTGFDDWAPELLLGNDPQAIKAELRSIVRSILQLPDVDGAGDVRPVLASTSA